MSHDQPQYIQPLRLAVANESISGRFTLERMERLVTYLSDNVGHVDFRLQFGKSETGLRYIVSNINAVLRVRCERCLESFQLEISNRSMLGIVSNQDDSELLAQGYEPIVVNQDKLELLDLIEDEMLLCIPFAPVHGDDECPATIIMRDLKENDSTHPFAKLKVLKQEN